MGKIIEKNTQVRLEGRRFHEVIISDSRQPWADIEFDGLAPGETDLHLAVQIGDDLRTTMAFLENIGDSSVDVTINNLKLRLYPTNICAIPPKATAVLKFWSRPIFSAKLERVTLEITIDEHQGIAWATWSV